MDFLRTYSKEIVALLAPIITWFLSNALKPKAQLAWASPHNFVFLIQHPLFDNEGKQIGPNQTITTGSILIKNTGKVALSKVEVVFNWKPILNIWPIRHFEEKLEADNRYIMIFDSMSPSESIAIELIAVQSQTLPTLLTVRSDQCVAKNIQLAPQPVAAKWIINLVIVMFFVGLGASLYMLIILIQFLVLSTPKVL